MELTVTNRSQAYPKAENGTGCLGAERSTEWSGTGAGRQVALRSKGTDENAKHFWKYPCGMQNQVRSNR